jgi:O-antigen ligase/Flp pilus assembly protein TadD
VPFVSILFGVAALTFFPFARDAFEAPHLVVLLVGALVAPPSASVSARSVLVLVAGAAGLAWVTSEAPMMGVPGLVQLLGVLLFAATGPLRDARPVVWASLPVAGWALLQHLGLDVFEWRDVARWCGGLRPFASLGHPTQLGVWMAGITVLSVDLASRRRSAGFGVMAAATAAVCLATVSRAGWLSLVAGLVTWGVLVRRAAGPWRVGAVVLLVVGGGVGTALVGPAAVLERLANLLVAPTRVALWRTALEGFTKHPLLGWGFDTFALVDQSFRQPEAWRYEWGGTAFHAHALPAQVLATQGLVGAVVLGAAFVLVVRTWRRGPIEQPAAVAVVVGLGVAALVSFQGVLVSALFFAALGHSLGPPVGAAASPGLRVITAAVAVAALLMLLASVSARPGGADDGLTRAARLEPWNSTWPALEGERLEAEGRLAEARVAYESARVRAPQLAILHANVGRVASRQGDAAMSQAAFERALTLAPLDARIALDAAEATLRRGEAGEAARALERLVRLYPSDGPAWLALGRARWLEGRPLEARAMLEASLEQDWRDWPEGVGVARELLAAILRDAGELELARDVASGLRTAPPPGDACGAPARLR